MQISMMGQCPTVWAPSSAEPQGQEEAAAPTDEVTIGDRMKDMANKAIRTASGTVNVALKTPKVLVETASTSIGLEEETAEKLGGVASLLSLATLAPLITAGVGVAGVAAVEGLGLEGSQEEQDDESILASTKNAYVDGVKEAYQEGTELADQVTEQLGGRAGQLTKKVTGWLGLGKKD